MSEPSPRLSRNELIGLARAAAAAIVESPEQTPTIHEMMCEELLVLEDELQELRADLPHCSRCGVVIVCAGADKEHGPA